MIKTILILITASLILLTFLSAEVSEEQVTIAIASFLENPLSSGSVDSVKKIIQFAEDTSDHVITIKPKYTPWLMASKQLEHSELLLAAFIAGNLKEQIKKHTAKTESYAGAITVIDIYEKIKEKERGFQIDSVEHWIALEKQGELKEFIEK